MPAFELTGSSDDRAWLFVTMHFPSDGPMRERAFARMKAEFVAGGLEAPDSFVLDARTAQRLLDAPSRTEYEKIRVKARRAGEIAGDLLLSVYMMSQAKHSMPSVNKAIHASCEFARRGAKWSDGRPQSTSESEHRKAWSTHKSVAHFWAAQALNRSHRFADPDELFDKNWETFLSVAAGFEQFGTSFIPERLKPPVPLLSAVDCWTLPPSVTPSIPKIAGVSKQFLDLLDGYKAPQAR